MAKYEKPVETVSAPRGSKIVRSFGRDNSDLDVPNCHGKELAGGVDNLAHSLKGASAVVTPTK